MAIPAEPTEQHQQHEQSPPRKGLKRGPKPKGFASKHRYVRLPEDLDAHLETFAAREGCTVVDVLRSALAAYLNDQTADREVSLGSS
jgi:hypothetical protein